MDRRDRSQPVKTGTKGTKVKATIACRASSSSTLHNPPARHQVSDTLERDSRRVPPLLNNGAVFDVRPGTLNRPMPGVKWLGWRGFDILFQLRFCKEMKALPFGQICARSLLRAELPFARLSLSHFPRRRASWKQIGLNRLKESFASARFACGIRSWATVVEGNKLMTKSMTGSQFVAASAVLAAKRSPSCQCSLSPT